MNVGDLVKIKRRKDRPAWIGLVVDVYETKQLVDRDDATSEWQKRPGVIVHWTSPSPVSPAFECYDESLWDMLEVIG
jgi:hypothetical protein